MSLALLTRGYVSKPVITVPAQAPVIKDTKPLVPVIVRAQQGS